MVGTNGKIIRAEETPEALLVDSSGKKIDSGGPCVQFMREVLRSEVRAEQDGRYEVVTYTIQAKVKHSLDKRELVKFDDLTAALYKCGDGIVRAIKADILKTDYAREEAKQIIVAGGK